MHDVQSLKSFKFVPKQFHRIFHYVIFCLFSINIICDAWCVRCPNSSVRMWVPWKFSFFSCYTKDSIVLKLSTCICITNLIIRNVRCACLSWSAFLFARTPRNSETTATIIEPRVDRMYGSSFFLSSLHVSFSVKSLARSAYGVCAILGEIYVIIHVE